MKTYTTLLTAAILSMTMSCSTRMNPYLGNGYQLDFGDGNSLAIANSENTILISMEVLSFAFDSTFIIASQRPWDVPGIPGLKTMTYNQRNEAFKNSTFRQYWIINKKESCTHRFDSLTQLAKYANVYGPFSKEVFQQKREELGVPGELQLNE